MPSTGNSPPSSGSFPLSSDRNSLQTIAVFPTPPRPTTAISRMFSLRRKVPISPVSTWRS